MPHFSQGFGILFPSSGHINGMNNYTGRQSWQADLCTTLLLTLPAVQCLERDLLESQPAGLLLFLTQHTVPTDA